MLTTRSADGTAIAYERRGDGAAVVLVGGAFNDHTTMIPLAEALAPAYTTYVYDRRGRGASGDTAPHSPAREVEDLAAVLAAAGGPAAVVGHSSGAVLALEAAAGGVPIDRLAVYEPSYVVPGTRPLPAADVADRLRDLVEQDRRGEAVALFLTECVGVPGTAVDGMRRAPFWAGMEALAHTLAYDVSLHGPGQSMPAGRLGAISVPTLVVHGEDTDPFLRAAADAVAATVPAAEHVALPGEDHGILGRPEALARVLVPFLAGGRP